MGYAKHHYVERALMELNFRPDDAGISDLVIAFAAFVAKKHSMSSSVTVAGALAGDDVPDAVKGFILDVGSKWADLSLSRFEKVSDEDIKNFQDYFFDQVCGIAAELKIPVQCHTGMGQLGGTRAINMLPLIRRHPDTVFSLMHGSFPWCSDILALLDMFRNVYADTVWLPHLSPKAGEIMLHELIECGTSDKVYWGCDSWHSEESYAAKLVMAECLAKVLAQKIEDGYLEEKDAHVLIRKIMRENAAEVFGERP